MAERIAITAEIRQALIRAIDAAGSQCELSRRSNVPQKNLSNYISGVNATMNSGSWLMLQPFLSPFLPEAAETAPPVRNGEIVVCRVSGITTRAEIVQELIRRVSEAPGLDDQTKLAVIRLLQD